jgi:2Fe-2S ferredoxin
MHIHVTDQSGTRHTLEALEGFRVMEIIRDWGSTSRPNAAAPAPAPPATCTWPPTGLDQLHPIEAEEEDMLDQAFDVRDNSRLSCQLLMTEELDGLEVTGARHEDGDRAAAEHCLPDIRVFPTWKRRLMACTGLRMLAHANLVFMIDKLEFFIVLRTGTPFRPCRRRMRRDPADAVGRDQAARRSAWRHSGAARIAVSRG